MKHIRPYETYKEILHHEFKSIQNISFSNKETIQKEIIRNIHGIKIGKLSDGILVLPDNYSLPRLQIYESHDEYFLIFVYHHFASENYTNVMYYKCDQVDGLIDYIKQIYSI